jgi:hypothetical protein
LQNAGDTALADALKVGQKRYFGTFLTFDWGRDGSYSDPLSDLSDVFDEAVIERELAGVIPSGMQTTEGYSGAKVTIKLSGNLADGTPIWRAFSPYGGYGIYGTGGAVNTPMVLDIKTITSDGFSTTRQITGWVDSAKPSRHDGSVTIVCFDAVGQLENGITNYRWAVDSYRNEVVAPTYGTAVQRNEIANSGTGSMCWVIDNIMRRSGFYEGPQWHGWALAAWTMRGSTLPEIGTINQERTTSYENVWTFGTGVYNTPMVSPPGQPAEVWSKAQGKYGPAFKGATNLGLYNGGARSVIQSKLAGSAQAAGRYDVSIFGPNNSNLLGQSMWVYIDRTLGSAQQTYTQFFLSDLQKNFSGSNRYPANAFASVRHDSGLVRMSVTNEGSGQLTWDWVNPVALTTGWHFISWAVKFTSTQVTATLWIDGALVLNNTNGGRVGGLGALTYVWPQASTNACLVDSQYPVQYVQWIGMPNFLVGSYPQPPSAPPTDPRYQAKIDLAGQRLMWMPNVESDPSGEIVQKVVGAELGAFYATEQGVLTFDSRETIKGRQTVGAVAFELTLDEVGELAPETTYLSIANEIGFVAVRKVAVPYQNIYATTKADQFLVQPGTYILWPVTLSDVQSIRVGGVTYRPYAQGYDAGLSPPDLYWQSYMDYYKPEFWQDGFTAYAPFSRTANFPPPQAGGLAVDGITGWADTDQNPRHMRIATNNFGGGNPALEYAVDDGTPFLKIAGTTIEERPTVSESLRDATSIVRYKERVYNLPADDWHQDIVWLRSLGASLLADTKNPQTAFEEIEVVGDPRRQLQDVVRIVDADKPSAPGMTGTTVAYGSVVGIKRTISRSGDGAAIKDALTIRTFPG